MSTISLEICIRCHAKEGMQIALHYLTGVPLWYCTYNFEYDQTGLPDSCPYKFEHAVAAGVVNAKP